MRRRWVKINIYEREREREATRQLALLWSCWNINVHHCEWLFYIVSANSELWDEINFNFFILCYVLLWSEKKFQLISATVKDYSLDFISWHLNWNLKSLEYLTSKQFKPHWNWLIVHLIIKTKFGENLSEFTANSFRMQISSSFVPRESRKKSLRLISVNH